MKSHMKSKGASGVESSSINGAQGSADYASNNRPALIVLVTVFLAIGAAQFAVAGTLRWPAAWLYVGIGVFSVPAGYLYVARHNPELMSARMKRHADAKGWDRLLTKLILLITVGMPLTAALQFRLEGPGELSWIIRGLAALVIVASFFLSYGAMGVNRHFERNVRIQSERGHRVVDQGPYRVIRHPSYLGSSLAYLAGPVLLGSSWAMVAGILGVALFVTRAALEDATLRRELPGYAEYAQRVRYRLVPGLW